jgi:16S rRNA U516 pseudouridylate synthase RsuA-like enzyme
MSQNRRGRDRKAGQGALARAVSKLGILSRSPAASAIREGRVQVNGRVETDPVALAMPERAHLLLAVGRLDLATSGLLVLTSDTRLAGWISDPAQAVPWLYAVTVRGRVAEADLDDLDNLTARATVRKTPARGNRI